MEDIHQSLVQQLGTEFDITTTGNIEQFLGALQEAIKELLIHDLEKLHWILYRIDVPERLANTAFQSNDLDVISASLTQLIYNRQLEKLKTRGNTSKGDFIDL